MDANGVFNSVCNANWPLPLYCVYIDLCTRSIVIIYLAPQQKPRIHVVIGDCNLHVFRTEHSYFHFRVVGNHFRWIAHTVWDERCPALIAIIIILFFSSRLLNLEQSVTFLRNTFGGEREKNFALTNVNGNDRILSSALLSNIFSIDELRSPQFPKYIDPQRLVIHRVKSGRLIRAGSPSTRVFLFLDGWGEHKNNKTTLLIF